MLGELSVNGALKTHSLLSLSFLLSPYSYSEAIVYGCDENWQSSSSQSLKSTCLDNATFFKSLSLTIKLAFRVESVQPS